MGRLGGADAASGRLLAFMGSIFRTMQTWMDTTQSQTQGYRDRVVHIEHTATEGGMNLSMPQPVIERLSERGSWAGEPASAPVDGRRETAPR